MKASKFRELIQRKPFIPIEISLNNGECHTVRHPESIGMARTVVVIEPPNGGLVWFQASAVTSVHDLARSVRKK